MNKNINAAKEPSKITVRKIDFDIPDKDSFDPIYMLGNATVSYRFTAIGLFVALLEPAIVRAIKKVIKKINNTSLKKDVERFCHQEAQHYAQHKRFNQLILNHGYPGLTDKLDNLKSEFERFLSEKSNQFMIGYIEGFEAFTTQSAIETLKIRLFDHPANSSYFADLFKWHMVEELEHRTIAFDLYNHLYGDYFYRARMCWFAQQHQEKFLTSCAQLMSDYDVQRYGSRCKMDKKLIRKMKLTKLMRSLKSMHPNYSPHNYIVPDEVHQLSNHYNHHEKLIYAGL